MEIALLPKDALKIKGKQTTLVVNPVDKATPSAGSLFLNRQADDTTGEVVSLDGPGEYEIGGIKITGQKGAGDVVYSLVVDDIDVMVGRLSSLEKIQHKVKEHQVVLLAVDQDADASFVTSLATNAILLTGEHAKVVVDKFAKENLQQMNKFVVTKDKLPQEIQTILLV